MFLALLASLALHLGGLGGVHAWGPRLYPDGKVVCPKLCEPGRPRINVELVKAREIPPPPPPRVVGPKPKPVVVAPVRPKRPLAAPKRGRIVLPKEALEEPPPRPAETTARLPSLPPEHVVAQPEPEATVIATPEVFTRADSLVAGEPGEYGLGGTGKATGPGPFGTAEEGGGSEASESPTVPLPEPPPTVIEQPKAALPSRPPQLLSRTEPPYPAAAKQEGIEGVVLLRVQVKADGRVGTVKLARSSGHSALDEAAARDVKRWRFSPALREGKAVAETVKVRVTFRIVR